MVQFRAGPGLLFSVSIGLGIDANTASEDGRTRIGTGSDWQVRDDARRTAGTYGAARQRAVFWLALVPAHGERVRPETGITPYTPEQNGLAERFIRRFKEECIWQQRFEDMGEARRAIVAWVTWYNAEHPHQAMNYRRPTKVLRSTIGSSPLSGDELYLQRSSKNRNMLFSSYSMQEQGGGAAQAQSQPPPSMK